MRIGMRVILGAVFAHFLSGCYFLSAVFFPPQPLEPRIVLADPSIHKEVLLEDRRLGTVSEIRVFPEGPDEGFIGIASDSGVRFLDRDRHPGAFIPIQSFAGELRFAGVRPEGFSGLIDVQTWTSGTIYDAEGGELWQVPTHVGPNSVAAADFTGDGRLEYVVGYNGSGGIWLFDEHGEALWQQPDGNVWRVVSLESSGDPPVIVHSNAGGEMVVRDASGAILRTNTPQGYFSRFSALTWPDESGEPHLLHVLDELVQVLDSQGSVVAAYEAPLASDLGEAYGTSVRLNPSAPPYFAVIVKRPEGTILYIYDNQKVLLYQEAFSVSTTGIAAVPRAGGGTEDLYVGGKGRVLRYHFASDQEGGDEDQEEDVASLVLSQGPCDPGENLKIASDDMCWCENPVTGATSPCRPWVY